MENTSKWSIVGHGAILAFLDLAIRNNTVNHAYVFEGKEGVGKETVAREMFSRMLDLELSSLIQNPDFIVVEREINTKTKKLRELISVEQIKDARARFQHSSLGEWKLMIIKDAHMMSTSASNALLKTLEEPRGNACIVMLTTHSDNLLPTIKSRSQIISFKPVARDVIYKAIKDRVASKDDAHEIAGYAAGCPGIAFEMVNSAEVKEEMNEDIAKARACMNSRAPNRILAARQLIPKADDDHVKTRRKLLSRVDILETVARDDLLMSLGCNELMIGTPPKYLDETLSLDQAVLSVRGIADVKKQLAMHINPKMALINLMLKIG